MQTRRKRQAEGQGPLAAVGAIADTLPKRLRRKPPAHIDAALQDLWPLSPRFPGPAMEVVRSKLPSLTLAALRLVCRAARDDFVDGHATRTRPFRADAPLAALARAAPRLRSLASLAPAPFCEHIYGDYDAAAAGCEALAEVLERLPGNGAALRELRVGGINMYARGWPAESAGQALARVGMHSDALESFADAVSRLPGLQSLEVSAHGAWDGAGLIDAASTLQALTRLSLRISMQKMYWPPPLPPPPPPAPQLLRRLRALALEGDVVARWLPALFEAEVAAGLTRLVDLSVNLPHRDAGVRASLPRAPWRAPWLSQLTRLALAARHDETVQYVAEALAPRALPALCALEARAERPVSFARAQLSALLAAVDAGALRALTISGAAAADVAAAAADLPSLQSLAYLGAAGDQYDGATSQHFVGAPLPPLASLELGVGHCLEYGARLAMLSSDWARGLREVALHDIHGGFGSKCRRALVVLQALSALPALRVLSVARMPLERKALVEAAAEGLVAGWAPRLAELRLTQAAIDPKFKALRELARLPLHNLERLELSLRLKAGAKLMPSQRQSFAAACAAAMPRLAALDFSCGWS